jgi:NCAIR mutase (PurE)-related protein
VKDSHELLALLQRVQQGQLSAQDAAAQLAQPGFSDVEGARVDLARARRRGVPEVVYGERKTSQQMVGIVGELARAGQTALVTRVAAEKAETLSAAFPDGEYNVLARTWLRLGHPWVDLGRGEVLVVCAGTSDLPVAEEAAVTLHALGNRVGRLTDVGVAGIHRVLGEQHRLDAATAIIVVAGMEAALPSVVAGLCGRPIIGVPTSVGYGTAFGGVTALLSMLNACSSGVSVVNIDNGFGAAFSASLINRREQP